MNRDYRILKAFVQRVRRSMYARRLLQGGIVAVTLLLTVLLLGVGVQHLVPLLPLAAPVYSAVALLVLLGVGIYVLLPSLRPVSVRQTLAAIEQTYPELHDDLTNAIELDLDALQRSNPRGIAVELVQALHQQTAAKIAPFHARAVAHRRRLIGLPWCGALVLAAALGTLLQPSMLGESLRLIVRPLSYLPPSEVRLTVVPQQTTIARGTNLEIRALATGRQPRTLDMVVKRAGQPDTRYPMESLGQGVFRHTFLKPQTSFSFAATTGRFSSPEGTVTVVPSPAIGQLVLHYVFPDYTGLPPRSQEGGGDIQALPGTRVRLTMRANVPITTGVLRFDDGSEIPLAVTDQSLEGEILVMHEGTYVVEVEDTHGLKNLQPPHYTVQLLTDRHPTVHLQQPQDGLEVDETTALHLRYEAEDDFGLQDATLVYFGPGSAEQRLPLHTGPFERRRVQDTFTWDMRAWPPPAGKTVQFYIEVYDNDTISGPKKGVSQTLTLTIRNREQDHQDLEKLQKEIADSLLDLLGDHLELADQLHAWQQPADVNAASPQEALQQMGDRQQQAMARTGELAERVQEALDRLQGDPYSTYETFSDMQAMQRNLDYLHDKLMPQLQESLQSIDPQSAPSAQISQPEAQLEEVVQELERLASLAEDIATGEKFNDLMNISTKMLEQQNQLLASLADLPQDFQGGELPPEVQEMLDKLDQLMQELADAVTQLPKTLPDEFLNRQLDSLPLSNMAQQLQELRQKLAAGDLEAATQLAEALLKTLSTMVGALQNMLQQARGGSMDAMSQQLQQSSDKLADLIQRQDQILEDTQGIDHDTLRQLNQAQQRAFEATQQYLHQELSKLTRLSWELSRQARQHPELTLGFQQAYRELLQRAQELRKHFNARNMPEAVQELEAAQRQMAWMAQQIARLPRPDNAMQQQASRALERLQAIRQRIDRLPHDRLAMLTPAQREHLGKLAEQQDQVRNETQDLHQAFEQLMPLMPFLPAEMGQQIQESIPFMGQASTELAGRRSQPAIPPEQQALDHLRNAQSNLQQALQQMARRGQMMGMSLPMLRQTGRLPSGFPQPRVNQATGGVAGSSVRNFQLPDKEAYKVPRMFREDIIEALKEGYPPRYKELIEQYYRNIIR